MPRLAFMLLLIMARSLFAAPEPGLIRVGDPWRYQPVVQPQPTNWFATDFDDSAWPVAPGGFSAGIYGRLEEPTQLTGFAFNYHTVLFRNHFQVADPNDITWLVLRADWDDAFVAFLNGVEIHRRGFAAPPSEPIPLNVHASVSHGRATTEEINLSAVRHLLRAGTNVLAVQVHNSAAGPTYSSICWAAELLANFTRNPHLQNMTSNSVQVVFKTATPTIGRVHYWRGKGPTQVVESAAITNRHAITIPNLSPGAEYDYFASAHAGADETSSPPAKFRTFTPSGPATFYLLGDSGSGSLEQMAVAEQMRREPGDFFALLGDVVYPYFLPQLEDFRLFSIYEQQTRSTPMFVAAGNHDGYYHRPYFFDAFFLPTNTVNGTEEYFSFDHGDAHFVVLDTDVQVGARYDEGSPQYMWLDADLAATTKPWKIIMFHHIMRSSAYHHYDDYNRNGLHDSVEIQRTIGALAARHGVQVIFTGHDHIYERLRPLNGVTTIVTGGGGENLYWQVFAHPESVRFLLLFHFLKVEITEETLFVRAIGMGGETIDEVVLTHPSPIAKTHQSTWSTPSFEGDSLRNADGNFDAQTFDLAGEPIPTTIGSASSLGAVHVHNDHENLYVGFRTPMVPHGADLLLFIGSTNEAGVSSMHALGNGIADPNGEGADSLDFLGNLAFANFTPAVAAILGDEFADATDKSFKRSGTQLAGGQGIFKLDATFSPVDGARLQQFNNSPQTLLTEWEQNADYIKVSVPLAAIGANPGDLVQLDAVVALPGINTNVQTRSLDSAALGSLAQIARPATHLSPVQVRLATNPDADGDGATDADEWLAGTDPADPASVLKLSINRKPDELEAVWFGVSGINYVLETAAALGPAPFWEPIPGAVRTGAGAQLSVSLPVQGESRYYRLRATRVNP